MERRASVFLEEELNRHFGPDAVRVICPITDPFVKHHGALGSFVRIYLRARLELAEVMEVAAAIGIGRFVGIPYLVLIALAVAIVLGIMLAQTRFGRYTYAIGSNEEAVRRAGVNVDRHLIKIYALAGTLRGSAGFMNLARFGTTTIGGHSTDNLNAIAAVVIGGTSLFGGIGSILGTVFGVFIPAVLQNGFVIVGVQAFWQQVAVGAVLILAVYLDQLRRSRQRQ